MFYEPKPIGLVIQRSNHQFINRCFSTLRKAILTASFSLRLAITGVKDLQKQSVADVHHNRPSGLQLY